MRTNSLSVFLAYLLAVTMPAATQDKAQRDITITLERTPCLGSCPYYKLTIRGDGSILYEGKDSVRVTGLQHSSIAPTDLEKLAQAFLDIHYFELPDAYTTIKNPDGTESIVTDLPTTYTSLTFNGHRKKIKDYIGAPKELVDLEEKVDAIAGTKQWVSIDAPSVHEEARHGWNVSGDDAKRLFFDAVRRGDADVAKAFIEEGVNVNERLEGFAPIQFVGSPTVVKLLIAAGADVNATSKKYAGPALVQAAELGDVESIEVLLDAGARVNSRSNESETPLMKAAESGNPEAVKLLLMAGAEVKSQDSNGETALDYARHWLERQRRLEKSPDPFQNPLPDYREKYKEIQDLLATAGGDSKH